MPEQIDFAKIPRSEVEELFGSSKPGGPKADSRRATELLKYNPDRYHAAKQAGCYIFGTISESMVPVKYRISKQALEAKRLADAASEKDDLIALPDVLADQMGVERGFRVSYENLQKLMGRVNG